MSRTEHGRVGLRRRLTGALHAGATAGSDRVLARAFWAPEAIDREAPVVELVSRRVANPSALT